MKKWFYFFFTFFPLTTAAQQLSPLTVDKIMRNPNWIGTSPSTPFWSPDGQTLYFFWNPEKALSDSLYSVTLKNPKPEKVAPTNRSLIKAEDSGGFNTDRSQLVFAEGKALRILNIRTGKINTLLKQSESIQDPHFAFQDKKVVFRKGNNLFACDLSSGAIDQLTNFKEGNKPEKEKKLAPQAEFLESDALDNSLILRRRKAEKEAAEKNTKSFSKLDFPKVIYLGDQSLENLTISPDGRFISYLLVTMPKDVSPTEVPNYVTQSGYIQNIPGRTNVGVTQQETDFYIYDRVKNTYYPASTKDIPGIKDIPAFEKNYPKRYDSLEKNPPLRSVVINGIFWNKTGDKAFVVIRALDHKDRWLMLLNPQTGDLKLLNRQHDDAWIGGPNIGYTYETGQVGWINNYTIWFQSEKTGYSHLYLQDINTSEIKALTHGKYEIQTAELSPDKKTFYITTNEVDPGQMQFYKLDIQSGRQTRITRQKGGNEVTVSPDGKQLAILFSASVANPWELYMKENKASASLQRITFKAESKEYSSYHWRQPDIITFKDRKGFEVYAELYRPKQPAVTHPGVIFVHGAGYLQDVQSYWSYYFREHMFMNLLVDQGYTVMDIDYRGSAGYGRDWRTAIYRHMGGDDLADIVDGTQYMIDSLGVNANKVGLWGGSYGGFMTLMALFKTKIFACGAALRSVTDWAHYNHGYTSEILNLPQNDSIAYVQSSPIYFADGLNSDLLMCHGMVDINVHFQDVVRLTQKLIELKKNHWELAVYPVESHGFIEPESWRDEYYRIYQLFEKNLMK